MTWWQKLDSTSKRLVVILPLIGLVGGWFFSFTTNIRVNAMALQRSIDAQARRDERVVKLEEKVHAAEADAAVTKAATATSINRITLTQEGQAVVNAETARQVASLARKVNENAAQITKTQEQLVQVSDLSNRIATQEKVIQKLTNVVNDLEKATTKLRKKVKGEPEQTP